MLVMKKILVVLLVLAVATGVFAQGVWTIGGQMVLNTRLIFDTNVYKDDDPTKNYVAVAGASGYFDYSGAPVGNVGIGYTRDGFSSNVTLYQGGSAGDVGAESWATMEGEGYKFQVAGNLSDLIGYKNVTIGRLWGYYKLLGGMVHLETAFNSDDIRYWASDMTGAFGGSLGNGYDELGTLYGDGDVFAKFDHHNYILGNVSIANLQIGIVLPNLFHNSFVADNGAVYGNKGNKAPPSWAAPGTPNNDSLNAGPGGVGTLDPDYVEDGGLGHWSGNDRGWVRLSDHVLKMIIVGAKFDMEPIEFAAQFLMQNYQIYLGTRYKAGPATIGLSFMGELGNDDYRKMKAGLSANYDGGGLFGAGVRGKLLNDSKIGSSEATSIISIEPNFFYNAIPTHLCFNLKAGFYFHTETADDATKDMNTYWGVQPEIFWNFLGTGAGNDFYWPLSTGMIIRYRMYSGNIVNNSLDLTFKFTL
jgi:hypothetical protein